MTLRFTIVTLFPESMAQMLDVGVVGRGIRQGLVAAACHDLRRHGRGAHRSVDDTPYGGGAGMVLRVDCVVAALEAVDPEHEACRLLMSPQGERFDTAYARALAAAQPPACADRRDHIVLLCGRYEGVDERIADFVDGEVSVGDFVLSGGELAAACIVDATSRFVPGVLGNPKSLDEESHSASNSAPTKGTAAAGLEEQSLEYPQYTRPAEFRGAPVPPVLLSGDHSKIAAWRRDAARAVTARRRPDLQASPSGEGKDS